MKKLTLSFLALCAHFAGIACSSCGCSIANQSIGLLSQLPNNFIGLQYQVRSFSTIHPDDGGTDLPGLSHENYNTIQLTGRYMIHKRIQLLAFVPYIFNNRTQTGVDRIGIKGIGDATVIANVYAIKKANCSWKQDLLIGGGVKAPTGAYDKTAGKTEDGLPNMQPGTHSWDFIADANYTVAYKRVGLNADAAYALTTTNSENYKFGNRLAASLSAFYKINIKGITLLPVAGASYDKNQKDYTEYSNRSLDEDSEGWQLYASAGVQGYYKRFGVNVRCQLPIAQHYNSGLVSSWHKTDAGIFFMF